MDIRSILSSQSALQAEKQAQFVHQLFDGNPELVRIFAHIVTADSEIYQQIVNKSPEAVKRWFLHPEDYLQAIQTLGLLSSFYGPAPELKALSQTWLLPAVRYCLNGMEKGFSFDTETASRNIATHLLKLNPGFTQCTDLEQTRDMLHEMFADQSLHWKLFV